ncbi:MAG: hypothetical protein H6834_01240 [Planctomycetes bacterium]|nr:hypothetical protein [Planctomycetota bacterium]
MSARFLAPLMVVLRPVLMAALMAAACSDSHDSNTSATRDRKPDVRFATWSEAQSVLAGKTSLVNCWALW